MKNIRCQPRVRRSTTDQQEFNYIYEKQLFLNFVRVTANDEVPLVGLKVPVVSVRLTATLHVCINLTQNFSSSYIHLEIIYVTAVTVFS